MSSDIYIKEIKLDKSLIKNYNHYPFSINFVKKFSPIKITAPVTFFIGENGSGKSTLIEAIATNYGFNPEGGSKNIRFSTNDTHSSLHKFIVLSKSSTKPQDGYFLRAESFYNVASYIDDIDSLPSFDSRVIEAYGGVSIHEQSHGESFWALIMNRFFGNGLYILDEPEAALSPMRQIAMIARMKDLVKNNSQFIISTHSPILMAFPDAQIFLIGDDGITEIEYENTENYKVTKDFLNEYKRIIHYMD